jgi:23S rRNA U2552 (ribose-2'-O)-methylase RlmE/FtsJ
MIKISYDINVYRESLIETIEDNDIIVELGSHVGKSSEIIAKKVKKGKIISLDNSPEAVSHMKVLCEKFENLMFISGDVRLHETLMDVAKIIDKCDVLSIDLGGGYHPDTVFKVYYIWASTLKPKTTIIRNRGLIDFVRSSETCESIESKEGWLESCNSGGMPPQIKEFKLWTKSLDKLD